MQAARRKAPMRAKDDKRPKVRYNVHRETIVNEENEKRLCHMDERQGEEIAEQAANQAEQQAEKTTLTAKEQLWQTVKYTLFAASAGVIQLLGELLFEHVFGWPYWVSYLIALVMSVVWNFTFNRRYTFRSNANVPRAMGLVLAYYAVFTPLSTWWGDALVRAGWNSTLVLVGTMLINFVTEFLFQRFVVFRDTIDTNDVAQRAKQKSA